MPQGLEYRRYDRMFTIICSKLKGLCTFGQETIWKKIQLQSSCPTISWPSRGRGEAVLTAVLAQLVSPAISVAHKPRPSVALQRGLPQSLCCPNVAGGEHKVAAKRSCLLLLTSCLSGFPEGKKTEKELRNTPMLDRQGNAKTTILITFHLNETTDWYVKNSNHGQPGTNSLISKPLSTC